MSNVLWFLLGAGVTYALTNSKGGIRVSTGVRFNADTGGGPTGGDYRGSQRVMDYSPLGTVASYPDAGKFGFGAYLGYGGGGVAGGGLSYADQSSGQGDAVYGILNQTPEQCNSCFGGMKS